MAATVQFLSSDDIKKCLTMNEAIAVMKEAFRQLSEGQATVPQRLHLEMPCHSSVSLFMPAYLPQAHLAGTKIVTVSAGNPERGLPLINGLMVVIDAETGMPVAVLDASYLTALRTGAASGAATDLLARRNASVAAVFGAGVQGRTQLEAVCAVRSVTRALVFDTDQDKSARFTEEMSHALSIDVTALGKSENLAEADIVCTATTSAEPVFDDKNLSDGVHINAVGAYRPDTHEIPVTTIKRARVFVDRRESCLSEAGDILVPIRQGMITSDHIRGEIGQLVSAALPGRESDTDITLFKSVGNAAQDLAAAGPIINRATELGLGTVVTL